jgi:hypothetical protein
MDPQMLSMMMQMFGGGQGGGQGGQGSGGGLMQFLGGMFGNSGAPYEDAQKAYQPYFDKATNAQQPYTQAGQNAIGPYQNMLGQMSHPSDFINQLMGQYQESPWAKFQQQQGTRALQNQGSASGLTGSTPMAQFAQQQGQNISSQDMQKWLERVLGVNTEALGGYNNLIGHGAGAANSLTSLYGQGAQDMGAMAFGQRAGKQQDQSNMWGGLANMGLHGIFN